MPGCRLSRCSRASERSRARAALYRAAEDDGSESRVAALRDEAERENVSVYVLTLPEAGKEFVSDTFSLEGLSRPRDRGGFKVGADMRTAASRLTGAQFREREDGSFLRSSPAPPAARASISARSANWRTASA